MTPPALRFVRADATSSPETADLERLLTATQVADILGVRPKRVYELGLPTVKLAERSLRYRPRDVASWIESRRTGT
jgi:predicted DNA-binding transcriptional regulator AlpA